MIDTLVYIYFVVLLATLLIGETWKKVFNPEYEPVIVAVFWPFILPIYLLGIAYWAMSKVSRKK